MVLNNELRRDRSTEAQREGRGPIQLFIGERAYRGSRLTTVPPQEFKRSGLCYFCLLLGMLGIQLSNNIPRDIRNSVAASDCAREINLNGVHRGNMVHDDADRTAVCA